ncbi:flagellar biosynthesis protein FlgA, partial [Bacillus cereus]|nr:flagellar biosynthesis protein FlgA [Bacillus cereus]
MKLKRKLKVLLPVSMMVLGIGTVGSYELVFKDKINTTDVIVAKQDIKFKSEITKDDIKVVSVRKDIA